MTDFSKREDVERWLKGKPREVAVVIAVRAALRVAPLLAMALGPRGVGIKKARRGIILPAFRGMSAPWVAGTWPTHGADLRANAAAYATYAATYAANAAANAANAAANAANAANAAYAAYAANAANAAANAAAYAANAAADIWAAVSADAEAIDAGMRPADLAIQALWATGLPSPKRSRFGFAQAGTPAWASEHWARLEKALLAAGEDWEVWTKWYRARLNGGRANEALEVERVKIEEDIWAQGPKVVNAHIKRLIKKYEGKREKPPPKPDPKPKPPTVPAQRRAAVEPFWDKGRLTVPKKPAKADLDEKKFTAALKGLRSEMRGFADDISGEANIDKRVVSFFRSLADKIPEKAPAQDELFRLGHVEAVFLGYAKTVDAEWPDFLASRYHALSLQFDRTLRQSPLWREFKRNAAKETLSVEQIAASTPLAQEAASALRQGEAKEFVDPAVPNSLKKLAEALPAAVSADESPLDAIEAGKELLAADLIESVNNTLKPIAEAALSFAGDYAKDMGKGFKKAAKKQAQKDGEKAFKWLRRLVLTAGGGAAGTGSFLTLANLIAKYPDAFAWLQRVLQFLN